MGESSRYQNGSDGDVVRAKAEGRQAADVASAIGRNGAVPVTIKIVNLNLDRKDHVIRTRVQVQVGQNRSQIQFQADRDVSWRSGDEELGLKGRDRSGPKGEPATNFITLDETS